MHIMLDFETLDIMPTALPLTLGMVWFDPAKNDVEPSGADQLHIAFDYEALRQIGHFTEGAGTAEWWSKQPDETREIALGGPRTNVFAAAGTIVGFMSRHTLEGVWGNGAAFDNAVLRHFFSEVRKHILQVESYSLIPEHFPPYKMDFCYRTLRKLYSLAPGSKPPMPNFEGDEHNALHDAIYQARCAQIMLQHILFTKGESS